MKQVLSLIALALVGLAAAPAQPPAPIAALTQAIVDAANTNSAAGLAGIYTDGAIVIDENPPFVWRGAHAGTQWFTGVQRVLSRSNATMHAVAVAPSDFQMDREGDDAYVTQRFAIVVTTNGKTNTEHGTQTYTFHKNADGTWKISRQIWTAAAPMASSSAILYTYPAAGRMMDAFNKRTPAAMAGLYAGNATFVDDLSPFVWDGANAGSKWYAKAMRYLAANGIADIRGGFETPLESKSEGDFAYAIIPVTWSGTAGGKPFVQRGTYTFTLQKSSASWRITSQTWLSN